MAILAAKGWAVVMCLIGSWFINQHEEVLVPTASMPDISTRVWQSIQIIPTLLVGFVSGPLYWTYHLSWSSVGVWPSSLCG